MTREMPLTDAERQELIQARDHDPKPYVRERAAAILKVAEGMPAARVARHGLLRPRNPDTVYTWLDRFLIDGIAGLRILPGRGRKPAFSPLARDSRAGCCGSPAPDPARAA
jgi:hypothetical protein